MTWPVYYVAQGLLAEKQGPATGQTVAQIVCAWADFRVVKPLSATLIYGSDFSRYLIDRIQFELNPRVAQKNN